MLNLSISGSAAADFPLTSNCSASLAPKAGCSVLIAFTPKGVGGRTAMNVLTKAGVTEEAGFADIVGLIAAARQRTFQAVNTALIDLKWQIGEYISRKIEAAEWGDGIVPQLAQYIA